MCSLRAGLPTITPHWYVEGVPEDRGFLGRKVRGLAHWVGDQPVVALMAKPSSLRGRNREQMAALIFVPLFGLALVAGAGVAIVTDSIQSAQVEVEAETEPLSLASHPAEAPPEPEVFHSVARYLSNLNEYREAILTLPVIDDIQQERAEQVLSGLEMRDWEFVGDLDDDVCFRFEDRVECVDADVFEALRAQGQVFAGDHPHGIGLCYDWFGDVCMSGDWFDSRTVFDAAIAETTTYVLTGSQPISERGKEIEVSPTYAPNRASIITDPELFSSGEWEEIVRILFPNRASGDSRVSPFGQEGGFCIGSEFDGDCFDSKEDLDRAMADLRNSYREGACSGWATGSDGVSVCTAIWVGTYPNHKSLSLGEAECDNNTGACTLIPQGNLTCLYDCTKAPTPSGPIDNSQRTCFWECEVVSCADYDRWIETGTGPVAGENWPVCSGERVCSWDRAPLDCAEYDARMEWQEQNGRPWGS